MQHIMDKNDHCCGDGHEKQTTGGDVHGSKTDSHKDLSDDELEELLPSLDIDDIWRTSKPVGKYQIIQYALVMLVDIQTPAQMFLMVFLAYEPDHICNYPPSNSSSYMYGNTTLVADKCSLSYYHGNATDPSGEEGCTYGNNYTSSADSSVLIEWNLVCESRTLGQLPQTLVLAGQGLGAALCFVGDYFGRRKLILLSQVGITAAALGGAFTTSFPVFTFLRLLVGAFQQGLIISTAVYAIELMPRELRGYTQVGGGLIWTIGELILALICYVFRGVAWRNLAAIVSLLCLVAIPQYLFVDESLRWLIAQGRIKEACKIVRKAFRVNGVSITKLLELNRVPITNLPKVQNTGHNANGTDRETEHDNESQNITKSDDIWTTNAELFEYDNICLEDDTGNTEPESRHGDTKPESRYGDTKPESRHGETLDEDPTFNVDKDDTRGFIAFIRDPGFFKVCLIIWFAWFINVLSFYGLILMPSLSIDDRYVNFTANAAVTLPAPLILCYILNRFNRRWVGICMHLASGFSLIAATLLFVTLDDSTWATGLITTLALLGKLTGGMSFTFLFIYTPEIFPTNLRPTGTGIASFCGRFGGILAPYSFTLADYVSWGPATIMGVGCLLVGLGLNFVPETKHKELAQDVADMKAWKKDAAS